MYIVLHFLYLVHTNATCAGYEMAEEDKVLLTIRLPKVLRDRFKEVLDEQDQKASQVLRSAIRAYIKQHGTGVAPVPASSLTSPTRSVPESVSLSEVTERPAEQKLFAGFKAMCGIEDDE